MSTDNSTISTILPLTANDLSLVLRDVILGRRTMKRACAQSWDEIGHIHIDAEGWHLVFFNDCGELDYCDKCISRDGRRWSFESVVGDGVDPIFLLNTQERQFWSGFFNDCKTCLPLAFCSDGKAIKLVCVYPKEDGSP